LTGGERQYLKRGFILNREKKTIHQNIQEQFGKLNFKDEDPLPKNLELLETTRKRGEEREGDLSQQTVDY